MRCPYCSHQGSRVTDSRETEDGVRRRRECLRCGLRFTTYERVQTTALLVVKRDGRREEFNRDKVRTGLLKACAKRPISVETIEKLTDDIERQLVRLGRAEVPSSLIGEMVMERLRALDHVAYVRFASVYRNFQDLHSFKQEVEALLQGRAAPQERQPGGQLPLPMNSAVPPSQKRLRRGGPRPQRAGRAEESGP